MFTYSIAIRTLGTAGDKFKRELESIKRQTVQPERVLIYIAEGYSRPEYTIGKEEYIWVKKGMGAQRMLRYDEVSSDLLMLLDDDVELAPDSAERMIKCLEENNADCVGADTFENHKMSIKMKLAAAVSNLVFPHFSQKWAFKIHKNGSFSYINNPKNDVYLSQSCAGPASLWKFSTLKSLHIQNERWIDDMKFAYGEDVLLFYKLYINGGKLLIDFNTGIKNLDGGSSSSGYKKSKERYTIRAAASLAVWYRIIYQPSNCKSLIWLAFWCKWIWVSILILFLSVFTINFSIFKYTIKGLRDGIKYVHSQKFMSLPPYKYAK